jgi:tetratricopeptide (TPR) repeat protein
MKLIFDKDKKAFKRLLVRDILSFSLITLFTVVVCIYPIPTTIDMELKEKILILKIAYIAMYIFLIFIEIGSITGKFGGHLYAKSELSKSLKYLDFSIKCALDKNYKNGMIMLKGNILGELGKASESLNLYDVVIKSTKNQTLKGCAHYNKSERLARLGKIEEAKKEYETAVSLNPEFLKHPIDGLK